MKIRRMEITCTCVISAKVNRRNKRERVGGFHMAEWIYTSVITETFDEYE